MTLESNIGPAPIESLGTTSVVPVEKLLTEALERGYQELLRSLETHSPLTPEEEQNRRRSILASAEDMNTLFHNRFDHPVETS